MSEHSSKDEGIFEQDHGETTGREVGLDSLGDEGNVVPASLPEQEFEEPFTYAASNPVMYTDHTGKRVSFRGDPSDAMIMCGPAGAVGVLVGGGIKAGIKGAIKAIRNPRMAIGAMKGVIFHKVQQAAKNTIKRVLGKAKGSSKTGSATSTTANASKAVGTGTHRKGTERAWRSGAEPNSKWTQTSGDGKKAVQNTVYDANGNAVGQVDFKRHGTAPPGHGHRFPPGQPGRGHGPGAEHIAPRKLPPSWAELPPGIKPVQ